MYTYILTELPKKCKKKLSWFIFVNQEIGEQKKEEYLASVAENLENSMQKLAQENYAQLPQETLDEMDYYSKYAKDILKQIGYNKQSIIIGWMILCLRIIQLLLMCDKEVIEV